MFDWEAWRKLFDWKKIMEACRTEPQAVVELERELKHVQAALYSEAGRVRPANPQFSAEDVMKWFAFTDFLRKHYEQDNPSDGQRKVFLEFQEGGLLVVHTWRPNYSSVAARTSYSVRDINAVLNLIYNGANK